MKDILAHLLIRSRLHRVAAPFIGLRGGSVILMYHRILPARHLLQPSVSFDDFMSDLDFISKNFTPVPLSAFAGQPPPGAVAITIDDGYREIYDLVHPLVKARGLPVTVFLVSDLVGTDRMLWTTELAEMLQDARVDSVGVERLGGRVFPLKGAWEKRACLDSIKRCIISSSPWEAVSLLAELREKLGPLPERGRRMLSWEEIAEMGESCVEFGSHTRSHAVLSMAGRERAWDEISSSKAAIESRLGRGVVSFCYPNGQEGDFTDETVAMVREAGYSVAVTAIPGANTSSSDRYALKRLWTEGCSRENLYARIYRAFLLPRGK